MIKVDGKRLIPAPFVNIEKRMDRTGDSTKVGTSFDITIQGTIVADMGSPDSTGAFTVGTGYPANENIPDTSHLAAIERKIEAIRGLFAHDGLLLEIQSSDGSQPMACNPQVVSLSFPNELWYNTASYSVSLHADYVSGLVNNEEHFPQFINSASESWEMQPSDTPYTYQLTHSVSAVGKKFYTGSETNTYQPWEYAQQYVMGKIGYNDSYLRTSPLFSGNHIAFSGLSPYNFRRSDTVDDLGGSYSCTETWLMSSGNTVESYSMKTSHNIDDGFKTVTASVDGTIQGLYDSLEDYPTAYARALSKWNTIKGSGLLSRINTVASGVALTTCGVTYDVLHGIITYTADYDNRPIKNKTFDEYQIAQKYDISNYIWTFSIDGKIQGTITESEDDPALKYNRALAQYQQMLSNGTFFQRLAPYTSGIINLRSIPTTNNVVFDEVAGTIQYSLEFNNRYINLANHEYQVSQKYSRDQGFTIVSINGNIQGYDLVVASGGIVHQGSGNVLDRYRNALDALPDSTTIYHLAQTYYSGLVSFPNLPVNQEYVHAPQAGTISYAYDFSTEALPYLSGAVYENLVVSDENATDVFAEFQIPGRTNGPYLQNMFTQNKKQRSVSYEVVVPIYTGNDPLAGYNNKPNATGIIELFRPSGSYITGNNETWDFKKGRYSINKAWTYSK